MFPGVFSTHSGAVTVESFLTLLNLLSETSESDAFHGTLKKFLRQWYRAFKREFYREMAQFELSPICSFTSPAFPYLIRMITIFSGDKLPNRSRGLLHATCILVHDHRFSYISLLR